MRLHVCSADVTGFATGGLLCCEGLLFVKWQESVSLPFLFCISLGLHYLLIR